MHKLLLILPLFLLPTILMSQLIEVGMETVTGVSHTTFKGDLPTIIGFSEIEITEGDIDTAFANFDLDAPRWLKELFPGVRIEVEGEIAKKVNRGVNGVRFFARLKWVGASFTISDPRLAEKPESRKLKNQVKSVRLSLSGKADELAEHLAALALADENRVKSFFNNRYDLEAYLHLKKLILGDEVILEWGNDKSNSLDFEVTTGLRFTADPSAVLDLGSVLFVREKLDSLMEGGILSPVENVTDEIAEAVQNVIFGKIRDPRVVPSFGWVVRGQVLANFGGGFSLVSGAEMNVNKHTSIKGTKPMFSAYAFAGMRWNITGKKRK